jgi:hypothetical protein
MLSPSASRISRRQRTEKSPFSIDRMLEIEISNNPYIDRIILYIDKSLIFCCNLYSKYISLIILIRVYI